MWNKLFTFIVAVFVLTVNGRSLDERGTDESDQRIDELLNKLRKIELHILHDREKIMEVDQQAGGSQQSSTTGAPPASSQPTTVITMLVSNGTNLPTDLPTTPLPSTTTTTTTTTTKPTTTTTKPTTTTTRPTTTTTKATTTTTRPTTTTTRPTTTTTRPTTTTTRPTTTTTKPTTTTTKPTTTTTKPTTTTTKPTTTTTKPTTTTTKPTTTTTKPTTTTTKPTTTTTKLTTIPTTTTTRPTTTISPPMVRPPGGLPALLKCFQPTVQFTALRDLSFKNSDSRVPIVFNDVLANTGSLFQNPRVVAPFNGLYSFSLNFEYGSTKAAHLEVFYQNKVILRRSLSNSCNCQGSVLEADFDLHMSRGDQLWLQINGDAGYVKGNYNMFSGKLVKTD